MKNLYIQPQVAIMTVETTFALCAGSGSGSEESTPASKTLQLGGTITNPGTELL